MLTGEVKRNFGLDEKAEENSLRRNGSGTALAVFATAKNFSERQLAHAAMKRDRACAARSVIGIFLIKFDSQIREIIAFCVEAKFQEDTFISHCN
jgi:hypothetical protein